MQYAPTEHKPKPLW